MSDLCHAETSLDVEAVAWDAFMLAALVRDRLRMAGGDELTGLHLTGDAQEAVMLGIDRLAALSRSIAITAMGRQVNGASSRPDVKDKFA